MLIGIACVMAWLSATPCFVKISVFMPTENVAIEVCRPLDIRPFSRMFTPEIYAPIVVGVIPNISFSKLAGRITIALPYPAVLVARLR